MTKIRINLVLFSVRPFAGKQWIYKIGFESNILFLMHIYQHPHHYFFIEELLLYHKCFLLAVKF
jgi:hypothetical protein